MKKYVAYDTETGGLDAKEVSLLTAHFRICDAQLQTVDSLTLVLKPQDGIFKVTAEALKINNISLTSHIAGALPYKEARPKLLFFLAKHTNNGSDKLIPVGHNVSFDDSFIQNHLVTKQEWEQHVDYRKLDTATIAEFLKAALIIPSSVRSSLGSLAAFFGVEEAGAHDAGIDVSMTVNVLKAMKQRITK